MDQNLFKGPSCDRMVVGCTTI